MSNFDHFIGTRAVSRLYIRHGGPQRLAGQHLEGYS